MQDADDDLDLALQLSKMYRVDGDAPPETKGTSEPVELKDLLLGIRGHVMLHSDSNDSALFSEAFREKLSAFSSLTFSLKKTDPKQEGYLFYLSLGLHRILYRARQAEPGLARGLEAALVEFLVSSLERHGSRAKWDRIGLLRDVLGGPKFKGAWRSGPAPDLLIRELANLPDVGSFVWKAQKDAEEAQTTRRKRRKAAHVAQQQTGATNADMIFYASRGINRILETCVVRVRGLQSGFINSTRQGGSSVAGPSLPTSRVRSKSMGATLADGLTTVTSILSALDDLCNTLKIFALQDVVPTTCVLLKHLFILHGMLLDSSSGADDPFGTSHVGPILNASEAAAVSGCLCGAVEAGLCVLRSYCSRRDGISAEGADKFQGDHIHGNVRSFFSHCVLERFLRQHTAHLQPLALASLDARGREPRLRLHCDLASAWAANTVALFTPYIASTTPTRPKRSRAPGPRPLDASTEASSSGGAGAPLGRRAREDVEAAVALHGCMLPFCLDTVLLECSGAAERPLRGSRSPPTPVTPITSSWRLAVGSREMDVCKYMSAADRVTQVLNQPAATPAAAPHRTLNKICMLLCVCAAALRDGPTGDAGAARRRRHLSAIGTAVLKSLSALVALRGSKHYPARAVVEDFFQNSLTYSHLGVIIAAAAAFPADATDTPARNSFREALRQLLRTLLEKQSLNKAYNIDRFLFFGMQLPDGTWPLGLPEGVLGVLEDALQPTRAAIGRAPASARAESSAQPTADEKASPGANARGRGASRREQVAELFRGSKRKRKRKATATVERWEAKRQWHPSLSASMMLEGLFAALDSAIDTPLGPNGYYHLVSLLRTYCGFPTRLKKLCVERLFRILIKARANLPSSDAKKPRHSWARVDKAARRIVVAAPLLHFCLVKFADGVMAGRGLKLGPITSRHGTGSDLSRGLFDSFNKCTAHAVVFDLNGGARDASGGYEPSIEGSESAPTARAILTTALHTAGSSSLSHDPHSDLCGLLTAIATSQSDGDTEDDSKSDGALESIRVRTLAFSALSFLLCRLHPQGIPAPAQLDSDVAAASPTEWLSQLGINKQDIVSFGRLDLSSCISVHVVRALVLATSAHPRSPLRALAIGRDPDMYLIDLLHCVSTVETAHLGSWWTDYVLCASSRAVCKRLRFGSVSSASGLHSRLRVSADGTARIAMSRAATAAGLDSAAMRDAVMASILRALKTYIGLARRTAFRDYLLRAGDVQSRSILSVDAWKFVGATDTADGLLATAAFDCVAFGLWDEGCMLGAPQKLDTALQLCDSQPWSTSLTFVEDLQGRHTEARFDRISKEITLSCLFDSLVDLLRMVVTAGGVPSETVCTQAQAIVDAVIENKFFPSVHAAARSANRLLSQARGAGGAQGGRGVVGSGGGVGVSVSDGSSSHRQSPRWLARLCNVFCTCSELRRAWGEAKEPPAGPSSDFITDLQSRVLNSLLLFHRRMDKRDSASIYGFTDDSGTPTASPAFTRLLNCAAGSLSHAQTQSEVMLILRYMKALNAPISEGSTSENSSDQRIPPAVRRGLHRATITALMHHHSALDLTLEVVGGAGASPLLRALCFPIQPPELGAKPCKVTMSFKYQLFELLLKSLPAQAASKPNAHLASTLSLLLPLAAECGKMSNVCKRVAAVLATSGGTPTSGSAPPGDAAAARTLLRALTEIFSFSALCDAKKTLRQQHLRLKVDLTDSSASSPGMTLVATGKDAHRRTIKASSLDGPQPPNPVCSFSTTGKTFTLQHLYFCHTCGLEGEKGCCSVCVRRCHAGHDASYAGLQRFYCDCGSASGATCVQSSTTSQAISKSKPLLRSSLPAAAAYETLRAIEVVLEAGITQMQHDHARTLAGYGGTRRATDKGVPRLLRGLQLDTVLSVTHSMVGKQSAGRLRYVGGDGPRGATLPDGAETQSVPMAGAIAPGLLTTASGSTLSVIKLAVSATLPVQGKTGLKNRRNSGDSKSGDSKSLQQVSKSSTPFRLLGLRANNLSHCAAAFSPQRCHVLSFSAGGHRRARVQLELGLEDGPSDSRSDGIVDVQWLPYSHSHLAVATAYTLRVYDLRQDALSPYQYVDTKTLGPERGVRIHGLAMAPRTDFGKATAFLLLSDGSVYACMVSDDVGLREKNKDAMIRQLDLKSVQGPVTTIYYSCNLERLVVTTAPRRSIDTCTHFLEVEATHGRVVGTLRVRGLSAQHTSHWTDVTGRTDTVACVASSARVRPSNYSVYTVRLVDGKPHALYTPLKHSLSRVLALTDAAMEPYLGPNAALKSTTKTAARSCIFTPTPMGDGTTAKVSSGPTPATLCVVQEGGRLTQLVFRDHSVDSSTATTTTTPKSSSVSGQSDARFLPETITLSKADKATRTAQQDVPGLRDQTVFERAQRAPTRVETRGPTNIWTRVRESGSGTALPTLLLRMRPEIHRGREGRTDNRAIVGVRLVFKNKYELPARVVVGQPMPDAPPGTSMVVFDDDDDNALFRFELGSEDDEETPHSPHSPPEVEMQSVYTSRTLAQGSDTTSESAWIRGQRCLDIALTRAETFKLRRDGGALCVALTQLSDRGHILGANGGRSISVAEAYVYTMRFSQFEAEAEANDNASESAADTKRGDKSGHSRRAQSLAAPRLHGDVLHAPSPVEKNLEEALAAFAAVWRMLSPSFLRTKRVMDTRIRTSNLVAPLLFHAQWLPGSDSARSASTLLAGRALEQAQCLLAALQPGEYQQIRAPSGAFLYQLDQAALHSIQDFFEVKFDVAAAPRVACALRHIEAIACDRPGHFSDYLKNRPNFASTLADNVVSLASLAMPTWAHRALFNALNACMYHTLIFAQHGLEQIVPHEIALVKIGHALRECLFGDSVDLGSKCACAVAISEAFFRDADEARSVARRNALIRDVTALVRTARPDNVGVSVGPSGGVIVAECSDKEKKKKKNAGGKLRRRGLLPPTAMRYICDMCDTQIGDSRWRCMDKACKDFDLCNDCYTECDDQDLTFTLHRVSHRMQHHNCPPVSAQGAPSSATTGPMSDKSGRSQFSAERQTELVEAILVPHGLDSSKFDTMLQLAKAVSLGQASAAEAMAEAITDADGGITLKPEALARRAAADMVCQILCAGLVSAVPTKVPDATTRPSKRKRRGAQRTTGRRSAKRERKAREVKSRGGGKTGAQAPAVRAVGSGVYYESTPMCALIESVSAQVASGPALYQSDAQTATRSPHILHHIPIAALLLSALRLRGTVLTIPQKLRIIDTVVSCVLRGVESGGAAGESLFLFLAILYVASESRPSRGSSKQSAKTASKSGKVTSKKDNTTSTADTMGSEATAAAVPSENQGGSALRNAALTHILSSSPAFLPALKKIILRMAAKSKSDDARADPLVAQPRPERGAVVTAAQQELTLPMSTPNLSNLAKSFVSLFSSGGRSSTLAQHALGTSLRVNATGTLHCATRLARLLLRTLRHASKGERGGGDGPVRQDWIESLCYLIRCVRTEDGSRRSAKLLLSELCGGDAQRHRTYDASLHGAELKILRDAIGGLSSRELLRTDRASHTQLTRAKDALSRCLSLAKSRPSGWVRHVCDNPRDLEFLRDCLLALRAAPRDSAPESLVRPALELLSLSSEALDVVHREKMEKRYTAGEDVMKDARAELRAGRQALSEASGVFADTKCTEPDQSETTKGTRKKRKILAVRSGAKHHSDPALPSEAASATHPQRRSLQSIDVTRLVGADSLGPFLDAYLLDQPSQLNRRFARSFVFLLWRHADEGDRDKIWKCIVSRAPMLPRLGLWAVEFAELVTQLAIDSYRQTLMGPRKRAAEFAETLLRGAQAELNCLLGHPDNALYYKLGKVIKLDQHFLRPRACRVCCAIREPIVVQSLKTLQAEAKHTPTKVLVKLKSSFLIQQLTVHVRDPSSVCSIRRVRLFYNDEPVSEIGSLRNKPEAWALCHEATAVRQQCEVRLALSVPVRAENLMIEFVDFYKGTDGSIEVLKCPRCNCEVYTRHAVCPNCRENARQCRQCRNINYENREGFLCNECGFCRFARFNFVVHARPCQSMRHVETEAERKEAMQIIESKTECVHQVLGELKSIRGSVSKSLAKLYDRTETTGLAVSARGDGRQHDDPSSARKALSALASQYTGKAKRAHAQLCSHIGVVDSVRRQLARYMAATPAQQPLAVLAARRPPAHDCFVCAKNFSALGIRLIVELEKKCRDKPRLSTTTTDPALLVVSTKLVECGAVETLVKTAIRHPNDATRALAVAALRGLVLRRTGSALRVRRLLREKIFFCVQNFDVLRVHSNLRRYIDLIVALCESALPTRGSTADTSPRDRQLEWEQLLSLVLDILVKCTSAVRNHSVLADQVALPCLRVLRKACTGAVDDRKSESAAGGAGGGPEASKTVTSLQRVGGVSAARIALHRGGRRPNIRRSPIYYQPPSRRNSNPRRSPPAAGAVAAQQSSFKSMSVPVGPSAAAASPVPELSLPKPKFSLIRERLNRVVDNMVAAPMPSSAINAWTAANLSCYGWVAQNQSPDAMARGGDATVAGISNTRTGDKTKTQNALVERNFLLELVLCPSSVAVRREAAALLKLIVQNPLGKSARPASPASPGGGAAAGEAGVRLLLDTMTGVLASGTCTRDRIFDDFLGLMRGLISLGDNKSHHAARRERLASSGALSVLVSEIELEIRAAMIAESGGAAVGLHECSTLVGLTELLEDLLKCQSVCQRFRTDGGLTQRVLNAFLGVRSLVLQRGQLSDRCAKGLLRVTKLAFADGEDDRMSTIRAYAQALAQPGLDTRTRTFALEQICDVIEPRAEQPDCKLVLKKARTQDEYIRGSMKKNPYPLSAFAGPMMRHVKDKICSDVGIPNEANMVELLVCGKIVSLDLSIREVYERLWKPALADPSTPVALSLDALGELDEAQLDVGNWQFDDEGNVVVDIEEAALCIPMAVTYRLTGLDGEATEDVVSSFPNLKESEQSPEKQYAVCAVLAEGRGTALLLEQFHWARDLGVDVDQRLASVLTRTLQLCVNLRSVRREILRVRSPNAVATILDLTLRAARERATLDLAAGLLDLLVSVTRELSRRNPVVEVKTKEVKTREAKAKKAVAQMDVELNPQAVAPETNGELIPSSNVSEKHISNLLKCLSAGHVRENPSLVTAILRVLPWVIQGDPTLVDAVLDHFEQRADWKRHDAGADGSEEWKYHVDCYVKFASGIAPGPAGEPLRSRFCQKGVVRRATDYLATLADKAQASKKGSKARILAIADRPSLPPVLQVLAGLCRGHAPSQTLASDTRVLQLLHGLEGVSTQSRVGTMAETLLESVQEGNPAVTRRVEDLRQRTRDKKRKMALARRKKVLKKMGIKRAKRKHNKLVANVKIEGLEGLEPASRSRLRCLVCREGYDYKPNEMLGLYVYNKEVELAFDPDEGGEDIGLTTVTHFNTIHFSCHAKAVRADASLKTPKREWDGAAIRNSHTLCNNLFPIRSPFDDAVEYADRVDAYWRNISFRGSFRNSRAAVVLEDLRLLLARFAYEESFAEFTKGGGKESNIKFVPYLIQMALHFVSKPDAHEAKQRVLDSFFKAMCNPESGVQEWGQDPLDVSECLLVHCLLFTTQEGWAEIRLRLLQRMLEQASAADTGIPTSTGDVKSKLEQGGSDPTPNAMLDAGGAQPPSEGAETKKAEKKKTKDALYRPVFLYWGIVDRLIQVFAPLRSFTEPGAAKTRSKLPTKRKTRKRKKGKDKGTQPTAQDAELSIRQRIHVLLKHQDDILGELERVCKFFNETMLKCADSDAFVTKLELPEGAADKVRKVTQTMQTSTGDKVLPGGAGSSVGAA